MGRIWRHVLLDSPMLHSRLLLALGSLTWAFFLLLPATLFTPDRKAYAIMAAIANENIWGILFFIHGAIALYTITQGCRNTVTLCLDGMLGCALWTGSTAACFAVYWDSHLPVWEALTSYRPPAAMSGELWVAIASWWHLILHWAEEEKEHYARGSGSTYC